MQKEQRYLLWKNPSALLLTSLRLTNEYIEGKRGFSKIRVDVEGTVYPLSVRYPTTLNHTPLRITNEYNEGKYFSNIRVDVDSEGTALSVIGQISNNLITEQLSHRRHVADLINFTITTIIMADDRRNSVGLVDTQLTSIMISLTSKSDVEGTALSALEKSISFITDLSSAYK